LITTEQDGPEEEVPPPAARVTEAPTPPRDSGTKPATVPTPGEVEATGDGVETPATLEPEIVERRPDEEPAVAEPPSALEPVEIVAATTAPEPLVDTAPATPPDRPFKLGPSADPLSTRVQRYSNAPLAPGITY
jgi:hypothetical protein